MNVRYRKLVPPHMWLRERWKERKRQQRRKSPLRNPATNFEVIKDGREVVARGLADTEPAACEQANEAARKAKLTA
jgi:hypothetical protein